jgi:pimeloyl-ACP methyl ester carboxylesterase
MVKLSRSARRNHLGDRIASITAPTLLIWGRQDIVTPPEACEEFNRKIADSRVVWFERCGHAPMIEAPELFSETLNDFLAELDRREGRAPAGSGANPP